MALKERRDLYSMNSSELILSIRRLEKQIEELNQEKDKISDSSKKLKTRNDYLEGENENLDKEYKTILNQKIEMTNQRFDFDEITKKLKKKIERLEADLAECMSKDPFLQRLLRVVSFFLFLVFTAFTYLAYTDYNYEYYKVFNWDYIDFAILSIFSTFVIRVFILMLKINESYIKPKKSQYNWKKTFNSLGIATVLFSFLTGFLDYKYVGMENENFNKYLFIGVLMFVVGIVLLFIGSKRIKSSEKK